MIITGRARKKDGTKMHVAVNGYEEVSHIPLVFETLYKQFHQIKTILLLIPKERK